jgi:hypothetical protein
MRNHSRADELSTRGYMNQITCGALMYENHGSGPIILNHTILI